MTSSLASLLFKDYRRRVLGLLLLHPQKAYHVREIARLTGTVAGTLHKELSRLAEVSILIKQTSGNQVLYSANQNCPIFPELASILRKTSGVVDVLSDALTELSDEIQVALVFGSMAKGTETAESDLDLLVVGDISFAKVVEALYSAQEIIQREINPKVYSQSEWRKLRSSDSTFVTDLLDNPKLFIIGDMDDLG